MLHPSYEIILLLILSFEPKDSVIIDYGCRNGRLLNLLPPKLFKKYSGYDTNKDGIDFAKKKYGSLQTVNFYNIKTGHVPSFGGKNSADFIILIGVLQYMSSKEIDMFINRAKYVLKPGGKIIASCVTDHWFYQKINLYAFFFPNYYINRKKIISNLEINGFKISFARERGLLLGPLFSHGIIIPFDLLDKILFRKKGELGPIGTAIRHLFFPMLKWENTIPIDYGYTFFFVAEKK